MPDNLKKNEDIIHIALPKDLVNDLILYPSKELKHQRRSRFISLTLRPSLFLILAFVMYSVGNNQVNESKGLITEPHIASIKMYGAVGTGSQIDADKVIPALKKAFKNVHAKSIVLRINSPGGSPVHAELIFDAVNEFKRKYDKPVYAVIEDIGASAAYFIAAAADEIVVSESSIVGSIGVISSGFGYDQLISKFGIERRVITSGSKKASRDPFQPANPEIDRHWESMLAEVHQHFIVSVLEGRGDRLNANYPDLFSGLVWSGSTSVDIGLADRVGSWRDVVNKAPNVKGKIVDYSSKPDFWSALAMKTSAVFFDQIYLSQTRSLQ